MFPLGPFRPTKWHKIGKFLVQKIARQRTPEWTNIARLAQLELHHSRGRTASSLEYNVPNPRSYLLCSPSTCEIYSDPSDDPIPLVFFMLPQPPSWDASCYYAQSLIVTRCNIHLQPLPPFHALSPPLSFRGKLHTPKCVSHFPPKINLFAICIRFIKTVKFDSVNYNIRYYVGKIFTKKLQRDSLLSGQKWKLKRIRVLDNACPEFAVYPNSGAFDAAICATVKTTGKRVRRYTARKCGPFSLRRQKVHVASSNWRSAFQFFFLLSTLPYSRVFQRSQIFRALTLVYWHKWGLRIKGVFVSQRGRALLLSRGRESTLNRDAIKRKEEKTASDRLFSRTLSAHKCH